MATLVWILGVNVVVLGIVTAVLVNKLPGPMKRLSKSNCQRLDGTMSPRRRRCERHFRFDFVSDIVFGCCLLLVPLNGIGLLVNQFVIPLPMAVNAMAAFSPKLGVWERRLEGQDLGQKHAELFGDGTDAAYHIQHLLWYSWPVILVALIMFFAIGLRVFAKYHIVTVDTYCDGLQHRYAMYLQHDTNVMRSG